MWVKNKDYEKVKEIYNIDFNWFAKIVFEEYLIKINTNYIVTDEGDFYLPDGYKTNTEPIYIFMYAQPFGMVPYPNFENTIKCVHNYSCKNAIFIYICHGQYNGEDSSEYIYINGHISWMNKIKNNFTSQGIALNIWTFDKLKEETDEIYHNAIEGKESLCKRIIEYKRLLTPVADALHIGKLCLVLGAGVSVPSHIPAWNDIITELLKELVIQSLDAENIEFNYHQIDNLLNAISEQYDDGSALTQMRYIKASLGEERFYKKLFEILYNDKVTYDTKLLKSIVHLCNRGVRKVISYNFDALLEKSLDNQGKKYNIVYSADHSTIDDNLNIYHVHGFIPLDESKNKNKIVFSEEEYHVIYNDPYNWSNIVQINTFRDNICLFVGCSMTDPNIRRLLDAAKSSNNFHYAIMKRKEIKFFSQEIDYNILRRYQNTIESLNNRYYESIGIKVIWVDSFDDIPYILENLE